MPSDKNKTRADSSRAALTSLAESRRELRRSGPGHRRADKMQKQKLVVLLRQLPQDLSAGKDRLQAVLKMIGKK